MKQLSLAWIGVALITASALAYDRLSFEVRRVPIRTLDGVTDRYTISYVYDSVSPDHRVCLVVLTDTQTGHFAVSPVSADTCVNVVYLPR